MRYELTDEAKERYTWTEQKRIQVAQFPCNLADFIQPEMGRNSRTENTDMARSKPLGNWRTDGWRYRDEHGLLAPAVDRIQAPTEADRDV